MSSTILYNINDIAIMLENDGYNIVENDDNKRIIVEAVDISAEVYYDSDLIVVRVYSRGLDPSKTRSFDSSKVGLVVDYVESCLTEE